ncbi:hypothetical protein [Actinoplanes sp. NPDC048796]|uniref:hypothetical protein n=1 Tax=Actinoplanes sp. NPDC048796 TaxID=3155640 RepID=UPI0033E789BB
MQLAQVLDVIAAALDASGHPDIAEVRRYGQGTEQSPGGVAVRWQYGNGASSYLADSRLKVESVLPTPARIPAPQEKLSRLPVFVVQLLDVAQPTDVIRSWELVALADIGPKGQSGTVPAGVRLVGADGKAIVLHATYGSGQIKEPEIDPHPEYQIPSEVTSWKKHLRVNAPSAAQR